MLDIAQPAHRYRSLAEIMVIDRQSWALVIDGTRLLSLAPLRGHLLAAAGSLETMPWRESPRDRWTTPWPTLQRGIAHSLASIEGDFAVAGVVDGELVLASDPSGALTVYYACSAERILVSTSLAAIATAIRPLLSVSTRYVAGYLMAGAATTDTPFSQIQAVEPGTYVTLRQDGKVNERRWWHLPREVHTRITLDEAAAEVRRLLTRAVSIRIGTQPSAWFELSGGFDSSSLVCVGNDVIAKGLVSAKELRTITYFTDAAPESDERVYSNAVESHCVIRRPVHLSRDVTWPDDALLWLTPDVLRPVRTEGFRRIAASGSALIVSGRLGDGVTGNFTDNYGDIFDNGALPNIARLVAWSVGARMPITHIVADLITHRLPLWLQRHLAGRRLVARQSEGHLPRDVATLFCLGRATRPHERHFWDRPELRLLRASPLTQCRVHETVYRYSMWRLLETPHTTVPVRYTYPFSDARLLGFVGALPGSVLLAPDEPRKLFRLALGDLLPPQIHRRRSKGYAQPLAIRLARPVAAQMLSVIDRLVCVQADYVDRDALRTRLDRLCRGVSGRAGIVQKVEALERWLSALCGVPSPLPAGTSQNERR